jgi:hypothetical protein
VHERVEVPPGGVASTRRGGGFSVRGTGGNSGGNVHNFWCTYGGDITSTVLDFRHWGTFGTMFCLMVPRL